MKSDSFKVSGWLNVKCDNVIERVKLLDTVESLGIPVKFPNYSSLRFSAQDTNLFHIDIRKKTLDYIAQPMIGAAMASNDVRFYSVNEFCRIAELGFQVVPRFPLFHIPHDGWQFPEELMESVCIPNELFLAYHEKMRDKRISAVVPHVQRTASHVARFEVSRLLCDVERYIGAKEPMEKHGMGFCYEKAYDGLVIKSVTPELQAKTRVYYDRHHKAMDTLCRKHAHVLLFDLHSYSDDIVQKENLIEGRQTPDVCIGIDPLYTPAALTEIVERHLSRENISYDENYPYSGCFVPNYVMNSNLRKNFAGIMIEVNKRFYCDQNGDAIEGRLMQLRQILEKVLVDCIAVV